METQFEIPPIRPSAAVKRTPDVGPFGVIDTMRNGFVNQRSEITPKHKLEATELYYDLNMHQIKLGMANSISGLALPLGIQTERISASKIGRLPGMESSHLHLEVFCGTDEDIAIEDVFHHPSPWEEGVQNSRYNDTA